MKAYILKIDTQTSNEYAKVCSDSCNNIGLDWEYFNGFQNMSGKMAFNTLNIPGLPVETYSHIDNPSTGHKAMCATAGHFAIWQKIAKSDHDVGIVLEHDAVMLQPVTIQIPENTIVVLGYKVKDKDRYDHKSAGVPNDLIRIDGHEGAHAYAITKRTAKFLLNELSIQGVHSAIDNDYFTRRQRRTAMPLTIASPTPAIGWLRESTIWQESSHTNYEFIPSFHKYYK